MLRLHADFGHDYTEDEQCDGSTLIGSQARASHMHFGKTRFTRRASLRPLFAETL
jgi:hypothetical protein